MGLPVTMGAGLLCSFGVAPSSLVVAPKAKVLMENKPAASIMDMIPGTNIPPFGMCTSLANPQVAAATSAAMGVLTPMPCTPTPLGPWKPGSPTVLAGGFPALTNSSMCNCAFGGVITITMPGQTKAMAP
ncbi:MAG: DUF4280 domain-containing protein [Acidimicrobiia bacterium]|nr:DUF4280 domain-containing protein [Acidimicrobiia bacterium]